MFGLFNKSKDNSIHYLDLKKIATSAGGRIDNENYSKMSFDIYFDDIKEPFHFSLTNKNDKKFLEIYIKTSEFAMNYNANNQQVIIQTEIVINEYFTHSLNSETILTKWFSSLNSIFAIGGTDIIDEVAPLINEICAIYKNIIPAIHHYYSSINLKDNVQFMMISNEVKNNTAKIISSLHSIQKSNLIESLNSFCSNLKEHVEIVYIDPNYKEIKFISNQDGNLYEISAYNQNGFMRLSHLIKYNQQSEQDDESRYVQAFLIGEIMSKIYRSVKISPVKNSDGLLLYVNIYNIDQLAFYSGNFPNILKNVFSEIKKREYNFI